MNNYAVQTAADFERAHNRAFFRKVIALLTGQRDQVKLLSFDEVKEKVKWSNESYIGLRTVPVKAIVGSVGRYRDFDREFLPVQRGTKQRWRSVDEAYYLDVSLPPVQLYKVGDVYFVKDGNHRVSVARERGVEFIDAEVIECHAKVPLTPDISAEDLEAIGEYADFLAWSKLDQLRPDQNIRFTIPGGYARLREHISVHRYFLGIERKGPVTREEAVVSWYDNVYMPVVRLIREHKILDKFPKRTEGDLYLWIMDHLYFLRERYGRHVNAEVAATDFAEQYSGPALLRSLRQRIASLAAVVDADRASGPPSDENAGSDK